MTYRKVPILMQHIDRRTFLQLSAGTILTGSVIPPPLMGEEKNSFCTTYLPATLSSQADFSVPEGKRIPFNWKTAVLSIDQPPLELSFQNLHTIEDKEPILFRISVGLDERDSKKITVFLPKSGTVVGEMDLRFVSQFQIYQIPVPKNIRSKIIKEGLALRLTEGSPLEIFVGGDNIDPALLPHLTNPGKAKPLEEFYHRINSLASIQQFGWMEGCVLDGLLDLSKFAEHKSMKAMAKKHLELFCINNQLIYEDYICRPCDNRIYGIEGTLPFAALAQLEPTSPLLDLAIQFWNSHTRPNGAIQDGNTITSEGAYTVGYAMAHVAKARQSEKLMQLALTQIQVRQKVLFNGNTFWRTYNDDNGKQYNRNWARGIAWQILGMVRTLIIANETLKTNSLIEEFQTLSQWVMTLQQDNGLWSVFADDKSLLPDTAGSSGIAAALALGAKQGWLDKNAKVAAKKTLNGLKKHLTPDGFLSGVSQSNKGGENLQRSNYRSIFQMGMGLMAQLIAALHD